MSDTMPERVMWDEVEYHEPLDGRPPYWAVFDLGSVIGVKATRYVRGDRLFATEQRALDAERERDALLAGGERAVLDYMSRKSDRLKEENAALRADLKALLPLARLGLLAIDANSYFPVRAIEWGLIDWHRRDTANLTAARAILDREGV